MRRLGWAALLPALAVACSPVPPGEASRGGGLAALERAMATHIEILASDEYEGRRPGTEGEAKTLRYLANAWQVAGLESGTNDPANPWFAPVELTLTTPAASRMEFRRDGRRMAVPDDAVALFTSGTRDLVERAPLLFVGEKGAEVDRSELAGRVAVMLWRDDLAADRLDTLIASGAAAVLVVGERRTMAFLAERRRQGFYRLAADDAGDALVGYVGIGDAQALFGKEEFSRLVARADEADFRPVPMGISATLEATSAVASVKTHNLVARLPGKRPETGAVLLLAHWDHFGICGDADAQDRICNGAVDNASGLAALTELARRLGSGPRLDRDVYFLATTAEEWGLLGAQAFADNPPIPLDTVVAAFNLDAVALAPRGPDIAFVGEGMTPLDRDVTVIVERMGRRIVERDFARQFVRRQDGWALLQRDVPTLMLSGAFAHPGLVRRYERERYHGPADEAAGIELGGAAQDVLLHMALVRHFADVAVYPRPEE